MKQKQKIIQLHWEFGKVLRGNFYISMYRIEKLEFLTWGFLIFAFDFELRQILFSHGYITMGKSE